MGTANRTCILCSRAFIYPPGANHPGRYCSHACRDKAMTTIPDAPCLACGNSVQATKGSGQRQRGKKYCSPQCYYASMAGKVKTAAVQPCLFCGSEIVVRPSVPRKYCSQDCSIAAQRADAITPELERLRRSAQYRQWRTAVFERDGYACVLCGDGNYKGRGETVELNADHIETFAHHPELRFDVDNGRTLCVPCHRATDNYGVKAWREPAVCDYVDATGY